MHAFINFLLCNGIMLQCYIVITKFFSLHFAAKNSRTERRERPSTKVQAPTRATTAKNREAEHREHSEKQREENRVNPANAKEIDSQICDGENPPNKV